MHKNNKLLILVLISLCFVGGVYGYANTCDGRLSWMKDSVNILLNHQKINNFGFSTEIGDVWAADGGLGAGENLTRGDFFSGYPSTYMNNYTYNLSLTGSRSLTRKNAFINGENYTGIGFYYKGDGSNNYICKIRFWSNETGTSLGHNTIQNVRDFNITLNTTDWRYLYVDYSKFKNDTIGGGDPFLSFDSIRNFNGITIAICNSTSDYLTGNLYIDNYTLVDLDTGNFDYFRWQLYNTTRNNARYNEGITLLAYMVNKSGEVGFEENETIINATLKSMDFLVQHQMYDGGWSQELTNAGENYYSTPGTLGMVGISFIEAYKYLIDNPLMEENITLYQYYNISKKTRREFYLNTMKDAADFNYVLNRTFNYPLYSPYENQEHAALIYEYLYANLTGNITYLNDYNDKINYLNSTRSNNVFGFQIEVPGNNWTATIGYDAGYDSVQDYFSFLAIYLFNESYSRNIVNIKNNMIQNIVHANQKQRYIVNGSRGNSYSSGSQNYISLQYNLSKSLGLTNYLKFYSEIEWDGYGNFSETTTENQFRSSFVVPYDYAVCIDSMTGNSYRFPMNYTIKYYDLLNNSLNLMSRTRDFLGAYINSRNGLYFPRMLFAYDDNNSFWVRGDYLRTNSSGWIYNDENGNFTLPVVPHMRIKEGDSAISILTQDGDEVINTTQSVNAIWISSSTNTQKRIASNLSSAINATVYLNVSICDYVSTITYTPNGESPMTISGFTCINNQTLKITNLKINPSASSNVILLTFSTATTRNRDLMCSRLFGGYGNLIGFFPVIISVTAISIVIIILFGAIKFSKGDISLNMDDDTSKAFMLAITTIITILFCSIIFAVVMGSFCSV